MRVAVDATPMLEPTSGIPRYCRELVTALGALDRGDRPTPVLVAFSLRGRLDAPPGTTVSRRRLPARVLQRMWARTDWPPVELLAGRCDVVHGTNFVLPPAARAAGVVTVHDVAFLDRPGTVRAASRRLTTLLPRALARPATVVVTPSSAVRKRVVDAFDVDPARVVVTPLGVDAAPWAAAARRTASAPPDRDRPYVVCVATAEPRKNLATLVAAHDMAVRTGHDVPDLVLIGGSGWGDGDPGARPGVRRLGRLSDNAVRDVVAGSLALALPSLDEGFGLPVLEAAAAGRPVLASDIPVLREVAAPGTVFTPPTDVTAWAQALADVRDLPDGETDRADRQAHAARYTWQACARTTLDAYRLARRLADTPARVGP